MIRATLCPSVCVTLSQHQPHGREKKPHPRCVYTESFVPPIAHRCISRTHEFLSLSRPRTRVYASNYVQGNVLRCWLSRYTPTHLLILCVVSRAHAFAYPAPAQFARPARIRAHTETRSAHVPREGRRVGGARAVHTGQFASSWG